MVKNIHFFIIAGVNEAKRSDRMELPKDSGNYSVAPAQSTRTGQHGFPSGSTILPLFIKFPLVANKVS
jgi:hypothetical protein